MCESGPGENEGRKSGKSGWLYIYSMILSFILISLIWWTKHELNNEILLKPCSSPLIDSCILIKMLTYPSIVQ